MPSRWRSPTTRSVVSYGQLLQVYFSVAHDPTELNHQGPDHGTQYRSEIFPQSRAQREVAKAYIAQLDAAHAFSRPIVTRFDGEKAAFYPAEAYHQDYAARHPGQPYIVYNDAPKVSKSEADVPEAVAQPSGDGGAGAGEVRGAYSAATRDSSPAVSISRRSHSGAISSPFGQVGAPNSRNTRLK